MSLEHFTVDNKVVIDIEHVEGLPYLTVRMNTKLIASFSFETAWDFLKEAMSREDGATPGLLRRKYEARNIARLTEEYLRNFENKYKSL